MTVLYSPDWIWDVVVSRVAVEFLGSDLPLEAAAKKYEKGLIETYDNFDVDSLTGAATGLLEFLSDIEAGEEAVTLLHHFTYFRIHFSKIGVPRKLKPMFGSVEDPVKMPEHSPEGLQKAFRTFVYRLRNDPTNAAPAGWTLETEVATPTIAELAKSELSVLDAL